MIIYRSSFLGLLLLLSYSCATPVSSDKTAEAVAPDSKKVDEELQISANYQTMTYSLSNNSLSSKTYNQAKAKELATELDAKLANPSLKDRKDLVALMAAKRLAGEGVGSVFQIAKKLMTAEMKDDIRREMPEVAQLELVLASIQSKQYAMAEYWIAKLLDSKNDRVKAGALTARGMIALQDGRLPEAIASWNEALAVRKDYEPARLNIGFYALRFGDFKMAKAMLAGLPDDFFVTTGQIQIERLADNAKEAGNLCASLADKKKNYKPGLLSCALNDYQGLANLSKARIDLENLAKLEGGPTVIDERAQWVIGKIDKELREQQAKEKAAAAAAEAAKAQAAPAAPPANNAAPQSAPAPGAHAPASTAPANPQNNAPDQEVAE